MVSARQAVGAWRRSGVAAARKAALQVLPLRQSSLLELSSEEPVSLVSSELSSEVPSSSEPVSLVPSLSPSPPSSDSGSSAGGSWKSSSAAFSVQLASEAELSRKQKSCTFLPLMPVAMDGASADSVVSAMVSPICSTCADEHQPLGPGSVRFPGNHCQQRCRRRRRCWLHALPRGAHLAGGVDEALVAPAHHAVIALRLVEAVVVVSARSVEGIHWLQLEQVAIFVLALAR